MLPLYALMLDIFTPIFAAAMPTLLGCWPWLRYVHGYIYRCRRCCLSFEMLMAAGCRRRCRHAATLLPHAIRLMPLRFSLRYYFDAAIFFASAAPYAMRRQHCFR